MPEAEDVILDAAERVSAAARALWRRHHPPATAPGVRLDDERALLSVLLLACFGTDWPILARDAEPPPGWLARRFGSVPPWETAPRAEPASDGVRLYLPRLLAVADNASDRGLLRVMALVLGARLARGAVACCPASGAARDLCWAAEGALAEGAVIDELPGLRAPFVRARELALAERPSERMLGVAETETERLVCRLLSAGGDGALDQMGLSRRVAPAAVAAWARETADRLPGSAAAYRGLAPVLHWGRARPDLVAAALRAPGVAAVVRTPRRPGPLPSRRLTTRLRARHDPEDTSSEEGPFVVPYGEPHQTVEDAAGLRRLPDQGQDIDLDTLAGELERLRELPRVRSDAAAGEILEVDDDEPRRALAAAEPVADEPGALLYPEWDWRRGEYRAAYCLVREVPASLGDADWGRRTLAAHHPLLRQVRRRFDGLRPRRRWRMRELDGDDLDLDAYVDDFADRCAGRTAGERLYAQNRPARREVAAAFLIDVSGSTDAWVSGGRRVLDVEKEAALIFCEALERLRDQYAVHAFSGTRARRVDVWRLKSFAERYGATVQARIAGLAGETYTRLGAPLRHLTAALARQPARVRLLLVLSDGTPNDEDEYDGRYGIEDARQAVAEARLQGVHAFCLAVRRAGAPELARIFGPAGYAIIGDVRELPARLPDVYRRLTRP